MRRTVTKLAVNKATFLSLSNQMTEQLGERRGAAPAGARRLSWLHEGASKCGAGGAAAMLLLLLRLVGLQQGDVSAPAACCPALGSFPCPDLT